MGIIKTAELTGSALDWAVATANGDYPQWDAEWEVFYQANGDDMDYSTNWKRGGPIIEREKIQMGYIKAYEQWAAYVRIAQRQVGTTPLIAAMRCYVASKLGDIVEIPEEILNGNS